MFRPDKITTFRFTSRSYEPSSGIARFGYAFDNTQDFVEELHFHGAPPELSPEQNALISRLLPLLHFAVGVSYYKAAVPPKIEIEGNLPSVGVARFFRSLYLNGLGEFAFQNKVDLEDRIYFPQSGKTSSAGSLVKIEQNEKMLVPMGGGKDSLVTIELLKSFGTPLVTFVLGDFPVIDEVCAATLLPQIRVSRRIDPLLFELNRTGALNGHVPISSIFSLSALFAAVIHGFSTVVASQERSANIGNIVYAGREINHQYSKSIEFERDLQLLLAEEVSPALQTYSLLRPFSEVHIAKLFSKLRQYHAVFTSCNRSFRLAGPGKRLWCCDCPKCRFVFLALAPFLSREELLAIFGKDLFADEMQLCGFLDVLGFGDMKPFECVGEFEEALWCLRQLSSRPEWNAIPGFCALWQRVSTGSIVGVAQEEKLFELSRDHEIPEKVFQQLDEYLKST